MASSRNNRQRRTVHRRTKSPEQIKREQTSTVNRPMIRTETMVDLVNDNELEAFKASIPATAPWDIYGMQRLTPEGTIKPKGGRTRPPVRILSQAETDEIDFRLEKEEREARIKVESEEVLSKVKAAAKAKIEAREVETNPESVAVVVEENMKYIATEDSSSTFNGFNKMLVGGLIAFVVAVAMFT